MRTTSIIAQNNQLVEIFVEKREDGFEVWGVATRRGRRQLVDHHLTHDDLEACLEYAEPGDLLWRDASPAEIPPVAKHPAVRQYESMFKRGWFFDREWSEEDLAAREEAKKYGAELDPERSLAQLHLGAISALITNKKEMNAARKALLGIWTDGVVTMSLEPEDKLVWSPIVSGDPLSRGCKSLDLWEFDDWRLYVANGARTCGNYAEVLRVDDRELHLLGEYPYRIARVFRRVGDVDVPAETVADSSESPADAVKRERVSRPAGEPTRLLQELERAVIDRNPLLAEKLNPGLPEAEIRAALDQAGVSGEISALIQLYSWSNGVSMGETDSLQDISFFPESIYSFMTLEEAIASWGELDKAVETMRELFSDKEFDRLFSNIKGQLFPIFADNGGGSIAVDLTPGKRNRIKLVDFEMGRPTTAYSSFSVFLRDAIRANREDDSLECVP